MEIGYNVGRFNLNLEDDIMKRYSVPCRLAVSIAVVCLWVTPLAAFPGGSGTLQDPYWIESASDWSDLVLYQSYWSQHFKLTANIDLSGVSSARVATKDIRFTGSLDGQGHTPGLSHENSYR